jgi:hypothetical protein
VHNLTLLIPVIISLALKSLFVVNYLTALSQFVGLAPKVRVSGCKYTIKIKIAHHHFPYVAPRIGLAAFKKKFACLSLMLM